MITGDQVKRVMLTSILLCSLFLGGCSEKPGSPEQPKTPETSAKTEETAKDSAPHNTEVKDDAQVALLNKIMQLARQGKVINCEFTANTTVIETVTGQWGEPDTMDYVPQAKGTYATYTKHHVVFGFNKGSQIFDVRSYDLEIKKLTLAEVKKTLGTPEMSRTYQGQDIIGYRAGTDYKLLFIFPQATPEEANPYVDHVNVFYPRGTVNWMADDPGREW
ncbi:YjgB family protein [Desulforamulus ruminis]|uniref:Uncharacterized protein n=1 Tax=Desulforamulus ruminis (strain ATCC 23193 / DSM 2154 / NCIMB 8452 / DL) TaxID=696281 RepID=F6DUI9_DESRL|nr:YjgB family protein [Desulforamulus ruminis]AEG59056.1 hypothetical protein Desru_0773 [Desulforamulus ruminis DSM 2154]